MASIIVTSRDQEGDFLPLGRRTSVIGRAASLSLQILDALEELKTLISQAEERAGTETEKHRVALWCNAIWEWMRQGREQYVTTQREKQQ